MQRYNPKEIEAKWQQQWEDSGIYQATEDPSKPKKYILEYFPYPSGAAMHVGHVRNYTIGDVQARFSRMAGYNVLHPMGWDAFGLPAENYAIKNQISPRVAIDQNTQRFKEQLMQMGFSYDWTREIDSTDPTYYRWTQWFFLMLFKKGLAYQQESLQWWCPVDKTVLANEQVEAGRCWRCGNEVEKKALKQWFFKITDYADRLAADLDNVDWSDAIKSMQRNWIGRSSGAEISFALDGHDDKLSVFTTRPDTLYGATFMVLSPEHPLVDTITTADNKAAVTQYQKEAQAKSDIERQETNREKTGVFTGAYAINPVNDEKIPVWVADYVLMGYGTGAIMAVPAHDERDYAFAEKFGLPIVQVVLRNFNGFIEDATPRPTVNVIAYDSNTDKYCLLDWKANPEVHGKAGLEFPGGGIDEGESVEEAAVREFAEETGYVDVTVDKILPQAYSLYFSYMQEGEEIRRQAIKRIVVLKVNSLKTEKHANKDAYESDATSVWLTKNEILARKDLHELNKVVFEDYLSPVPFHGEGIAINFGDYDGTPTSDVREKIVADLAAKGTGKERINYKMRDWLISRQRYWGAPIPIIHCPKHGAVAVPDDQLPVVLPELEKFEPSGDGRSPLANVAEFVNTTCPQCGGPAERETDTMDGFACSSWYFLRFADPHNDDVAFDADKAKFWLPVDDYIGGAEHAVMHLLYARFWTKVMHDEGLIDFDEPFTKLRNHGMILAPDGQKMSKSKGNTIEPGVLIDQGYGADSIRIMELFIGPWNQAANWSVEGMGGAYRFLQRIWTLVQEYKDATATGKGEADSTELLRAVNKAVHKVTQDIETMSFNTAIAALMELTNELYRLKASDHYSAKEWGTALQAVVQVMAPFAPHIAEELWSQLGQTESVHLSSWPAADSQYLTEDTITIAVQVNGKLRGEVTVAAGTDEQQILEAAKMEDRVIPHIEGKDIRKAIYVPGRLVNFVVT